MADIYTCAVCGMKITLNMLTEHILLHDQYSTFTYNETTKIVEPLDEDLQQKHVVTPPSPQKSISSYLPSSLAFVPGMSYKSTATPGVITIDATANNDIDSNFEHFEKPSRNEDLKSKNYSIASNLQGLIAESPLDNLTGIQMIANVAESLDKREKLGASINNTTPGWLDENGKMNIDKPLEIGDVIGTIKLPLTQNGMEGISCECSIVFHRYVNENQTIVEETNEVPGYEDLNLEDIINNSEEDVEDEEEDFGEDFIDSSHSIVKRRKLDSESKERKSTWKMEVYKYKEAADSVNVQNELQNSIVPELLKDPAVVRYLETMTGRTIQPMIKEAATEVEEINETDEDRGVEIYNRITIDMKEQTNAVNYNVNDINNLDQVDEDASEDVEENQAGKKVNTIIVKTDPKKINSESNKFLNIDDNLKDIPGFSVTSLRKEEKTGTDVVTDLTEASENDDSEQEMMDIESNIQETSPNVENMKDSISKKQISLFSFQVEQFVEDITKEVKEKFCNETTNDGKEKDISLCNVTAGNHDENVYNILELQSSNPYSVIEKQSKFCCSVCQKSFQSFDDLAKHLYTHKKDKIESRDSVRVINEHLNLVSEMVSENMTETVSNSSCDQSSEKLLFYCMVCSTMLPSQKELQEHSKLHKNSRGNSDNIVKLDGTSASEDTLTAESDPECLPSNDTHIDNDTTECKVSSRRIIYEIVSNRSDKKKRPKMPKKKTIRNDYICENCGTGFFNIHECTSHMEKCKDSRILKCFQGCGSRFKSKSLLDVHKKFCSRRLAYLERINNELVKVENPVLNEDKGIEEIDDQDENLFKCPFCGGMYRTEIKKNHHQLVCRLRPKQQCSHCDFQCKGDKSMAKHLVAEHGLKPFQCQHCQRSFRLKNSLNDHIRSIHTKETFTCEYCGKSFIKQSVYRSHVSIQHEGFRLECSYCGKKFKDKKTWKTHETSHKGVYDFACDVCKKTFNRSEQYKAHMQAVHSIDGETALSLNSAARKLREELCSNVCSICTEKFPLESAYVVHMMKVHGQEVSTLTDQIMTTEIEQVTCPVQNF